MTAIPVSYIVCHRTVDGEILDIIRDFNSLEYTLTENDYGSLYIDLPANYPDDYFKIDDRLEVYRTVSNSIGGVEGGKPYFIRLVRIKYDETHKKYLHILAYDAIHLLSRRIIAYPGDTSYTLKSGSADQILVAIFRENFGDLQTDLDGLPSSLTQRKFPDYAQHYAQPSGNAASITTDDMSRLLVLPRMQSICEQSRNAGYYLSFDYVLQGYKDLTFTTYIGQRGANHGKDSPTQLKFSVFNQNLSYSSFEMDHTEVKNFVYAGGRGQSNNKLIETEADYNTWNLSPFNRCEDWMDTDTEILQEAADAAAAIVKERAAKMIFNGHITQTPECLYGLHYQWGDVITVVQDNITFDVHLSTINIKVSSDNAEEINAYARNYNEGEF